MQPITPIQLAVNTQEQLVYLQRHGAKILWDGGGQWIVEVTATRCGQSTWRLKNGDVFNPHAALSDLVAEAERIRH